MTEYLSSIGPAVGNHLWQTTAFAAAVWAATLLLRRNAARVRYGLWLAASLKFLLPFSLLVGLGGMLPRPQRAVVAMPVYSAVDSAALPFSEMAVTDPTHAAIRPRHEWGTQLTWPEVLGVVWLCGAVVVLLVWGARWRRVARTVRRAARVDAGREWELLRRVEASVGLRKRSARAWAIPLMLSREMMEPGIFGIFRPVLIWPERLSERLDDEHIEAILAHELMHVRRRDNLTAALHMFVEAAFWFHPMVWWMGARMVEERERACDEAVVEMGSRPGVYAESLLTAVRFCVESPLTCVAGITGADLTRRVRSIMTLRLERMGWGRKLLLLVFALAVVAVPVLLGQVKAAQRMMLAAVNAAPAPLRAAAHAMMAEEQTPSKGLIANEAAGTQDAASDAALADAVTGPAFEVASIRPENPNDGRNGWGVRLDASGRFITSGESLSQLVWIAYIRTQGQGKVSGGPKWSQSDSWDINAKVDDAYMAGWDKLSEEQRWDRVRPMIRRLLSERFHLKLRIETQPTPVYMLVQAKGGAKMKEVPAPDPVEDDPMEAFARQMRENPSKPIPGNVTCWGTTCTGRAVRMINAIGMISGFSQADRIVIDQTGLKGYYNFTFTQPHSNHDDSAMAVIEDDLGLKFEPRTVPMKTYIIDSAEKPSVDGAEVTADGAGGIAQASAPAAPSSPTTDAPPAPSFDVATIKPNASDTPLDWMGIRNNPDGIDAQFVTLPMLIQRAYSLRSADQVFGGPEWAKNVRFDIQAKMSEVEMAEIQKLGPAETKARRELMLQALLSERFKLKVHSETKQVPVFELVVAKGGPKLKDAATDPNPPLGKVEDGKPLVGFNQATKRTMVAQGESTKALADLLSQPTSGLERPVVDKTGLNGAYDFTLNWVPHFDRLLPGAASSAASPEDAVSIFEALQQIGLKLQPATGPIDFIVIDHVERPSAN